MKIRKTLLSYACAIMVALSFSACGDDWGRQDDPAGGQVYPSKQTVATYDFEYTEEKPEYSDMVSHDEACEVIKDDFLASNVLHINGKGSAKIANPFNSVKLQNGAAITFAVKIDADVDEEGKVSDVDLTRPLIAFGSDADADGNDTSARFYFTANGQVVYEKPGQLQSLNLNENDPASVKTGILSPNEWHFVALQVSNDGYQFYIDGKKSLSGYQTSSSSTSFQYKTLVEAINDAPYLYLGGDEVTAETTNAIALDNVTLIRNMMEDKDWNKTIDGNGGDETFKYIEYVNADGTPTTEIGTSDCSAAWWTSFSDYYRIPAGATLHLKFTNHTSGGSNWNNWNLCVANDNVRSDQAPYAEHFVMRSDLYGWGGAASTYNAANISNEGYGDWDEFKANMEGAVVEITLQREGDEIYMTATATCKNGHVYKEMYHQTIGQDVVRAFLIVDGSYLQMSTADCFISDPATVETTEIGTSDCSAAWWTSFSDYFQIPEGKTLNLAFENHTSGGSNWNNWNLCVANDNDRSDQAPYAEHFVMRSDLYGWGGAASTYNAANISNEGYGDWDEFKANMEGAKVNIQLQRQGEEIYMTAVATCTNGTVYKEMYHQTIGTDMVRAFLIVDGSYLKMDANNCYLATPIY